MMLSRVYIVISVLALAAIVAIAYNFTAAGAFIYGSGVGYFFHAISGR